MESLSGGTISISNIGTIGGTYASPIINPPESTILAIGKVKVLPRYQDNNFEKVGNAAQRMASREGRRNQPYHY